MSSMSTPVVAPLVPDVEDEANAPMPDSERAEERRAERTERVLEGRLNEPFARTEDGRRAPDEP